MSSQITYVNQTSEKKIEFALYNGYANHKERHSVKHSETKTLENSDLRIVSAWQSENQLTSTENNPVMYTFQDGQKYTVTASDDGITVVPYTD